MVDFDAEAHMEVSDLLHGPLAEIAIPDAFTEPIATQAKAAVAGTKEPDRHRIYVDAYVDMCRLLEEYRFEVALAALLLVDYTVKLERGEVAKQKSQVLPMPVESEALLRRYFRTVPEPGHLFTDPYQEIAGHRILGRWFAGQLLDSAMFRGLAVCDRLTIMLWVRADLPSSKWQPAYRPKYLKSLRSRYAGRDGWDDFIALESNELFVFARDMRDGFTHHRRVPSNLHGDVAVVYAGEPVTAGQAVLSASDHLAMTLALYDAILRPFVAAAAKLIAAGPVLRAARRES